MNGIIVFIFDFFAFLCRRHGIWIARGIAPGEGMREEVMRGAQMVTVLMSIISAHIAGCCRFDSAQ